MNSIVKNHIERVAINFLIENIKEYPIDVYQLANKVFDNIFDYSGYELYKNPNISNAIKDGMSLKMYNETNDKIESNLYYNSSVLITRQRFTIMHEIGHILLNHSQSSQLSEQEANYFASYSLAPFVLIFFLQLKSENDISQVFNLSKECSKNIFDNYLKWKERITEKKVVMDYERQFWLKINSGEIIVKNKLVEKRNEIDERC